MKILIAIYSLGYGGAEKQVVMDANGLYEKGHDVTVAFAKDGPLNDLLVEGITRYHVKVANILLASVKMFFYLMKHPFDILHAHMFWAMKVLVFGGAMFRNKIIFNEHGLGVWRKWYHKLVLHFIAPFAHIILNSCDATKNNRVTLDNLKPQKLLTLYNSFENSVSDKKNKENRLVPFSSKRTPHAFTIGFLGRFDPVKRLHLFIPLVKKLLAEIPDVKCLLVGDGPERQRIESAIQEEKLEEHFVLTGYLLNPWDHLKDMADVFFMPSLREAFSVTLLECGAAGVPAIAFNVGGNAEIIQDSRTGYIVPNLQEETISEVAEKLLFLFHQTEEREKMGNAARDFVVHTFSIEKRIEKLEKIYRS